MAETDRDRILEEWASDLEDEVVTELTDDAASKIASSAAASAAGTVAGAGAGAAVAGTSAFATATFAKVLIAATLAVSLAGGIAAVNGVLPDPIQEFVADVGESIGIDLPRPSLQSPDPNLATTLTLPELPGDTDDLLDPDSILPEGESTP